MRGIVVGRVVEQDQVAVLRLGLRRVVVRVVAVLAGGDQREVRDALRVVDLEDVVADRFDLVLVHPRPGRAHGLHHSHTGDSRGFADQRDLARALDEAQRIDERIEILDSSDGAAARTLSMNRVSRDLPPSQGSASEAFHRPRGSLTDAPPSTSGLAGM